MWVYSVICPECGNKIIDVGEEYLECEKCGWVMEDNHRISRENKKLKKLMKSKYGEAED